MTGTEMKILRYRILPNSKHPHPSSAYPLSNLYFNSRYVTMHIFRFISITVPSVTYLLKILSEPKKVKYEREKCGRCKIDIC
jgi:hypothetical protein